MLGISKHTYNNSTIYTQRILRMAIKDLKHLAAEEPHNAIVYAHIGHAIHAISRTHGSLNLNLHDGEQH